MRDTLSGHPVILFDGERNLCIAWVSFVIQHDHRGSFRFAPRHSDAARRLLAPFAVPPDALGSIALITGPTLVTRSDAVLRIFAQLEFPWRLASCLVVIPRPLRDVVYTWVARNRHRLSRGKAGCRLPLPEDGDRFVR
jgi:predicted DCC family thiol-disulfide oxidoreductase YuxK